MRGGEGKRSVAGRGGWIEREGRRGEKVAEESVRGKWQEQGEMEVEELE